MLPYRADNSNSLLVLSCDFVAGTTNHSNIEVNPISYIHSCFIELVLHMFHDLNHSKMPSNNKVIAIKAVQYAYVG